MSTFNYNGAVQKKGLVVFLMGPTATGKSDLALELVESLPLEIISVDSAMVYRQMDIGTAKPTPMIREAVPHALIDIVDPSVAYSAGKFREDALFEIGRIFSAGRIPLLVGGTMLYYRALQSGLSGLPQADETYREWLLEESRRVGWTELHQRLEKVDPDSAARIHPNDPQRIMRALEVFELTGLSLTECFERQHVGESAFDVMKMALIPDDRTRLHERIEARFDTMLEMGFVDEVKLLKDRADLDPGKPSMRAVGYRQIWEYLEGKTTLSQARDKAVIATRQLAKRQLTWLRSEQDMRGFDPLVAETAKRVREQIALEVSKYL